MIDSREAKSTAEVSDKAMQLAFPDGSSRALKRPLPGFDSIDTALQDFAEGKFVVVLDNEDRENEGDLIMAADKVSSLAMPLQRRCRLCSTYHLPWAFLMYQSQLLERQKISHCKTTHCRMRPTICSNLTLSPYTPCSSF